MNKFIVEYRFSKFGTWHSAKSNQDIMKAIENGCSIESAPPIRFDSFDLAM